ncbi:unnamed protein product, partial [Nesidiocoris tenuis]
MVNMLESRPRSGKTEWSYGRRHMRLDPIATRQDVTPKYEATSQRAEQQLIRAYEVQHVLSFGGCQPVGYCPATSQEPAIKKLETRRL